MTTINTDHQYKVWVAIERYTPPDTYEDAGLPDPIGTFDTLAAARAFVRTIPGWTPEHSDHRKEDDS